VRKGRNGAPRSAALTAFILLLERFLGLAVQAIIWSALRASSSLYSEAPPNPTDFHAKIMLGFTHHFKLGPKSDWLPAKIALSPLTSHLSPLTSPGLPAAPDAAGVIGAFTFPFAIGSVNLTSQLRPRTPLQNRRTLGRCVVRARRRPIPCR
jgi:hypothetical protein